MKGHRDLFRPGVRLRVGYPERPLLTVGKIRIWDFVPTLNPGIDSRSESPNFPPPKVPDSPTVSDSRLHKTLGLIGKNGGVVRFDPTLHLFFDWK